MPLSYEELFYEFSGSGNINGKFWFIGLESGGSLQWDNENDEYVKILKTQNKDQILEYLNDFDSTEISPGFETILFNLIQATYEVFKDPALGTVTADKNLMFKNNPSVFRTNLSLLKLRDNNETTFAQNIEHYKKYLNFKNVIATKNDLYNNILIKERANAIKVRLTDLFEERRIFLLTTRYYEDLAVNFIKEIFGIKNLKERRELINIKNRYINFYHSEKGHVQIFALPQRPRFDQCHYKSAIRNCINSFQRN